MKRWFIFWLLLISNALVPPAFSATTSITNVKISSLEHFSRFVFSANTPFRYKNFSLSNPDRLVIDIQQAKLTTQMMPHDLSTTPVKAIRSFVHKQGYLRIVFDLKKPATIKVYSLTATHYSAYRLVVDLQTPLPSQRITNTIAMPQAALSLTKRPKLRNIIVVIDPGHGGKDPGATGRGRHREKTIVLAIAKKLQYLLNQQPGFTAKLTRHDDYFISLGQRLKIARRDKADFFIAIHADAFQDTDAEGASIYALSERGATSVAARWLAQKENESELMGGTTLNDKDLMVRSVLINLSQNYSISVSLKVGAAMLQQLSTLTLLHYHRIEQAAFVVLKSPDIPSLLVETGFISNPHEEQRLINPQYQQRMAQALMLGIKNYYLQNPPPDSILAAANGRQFAS